MLAWPILYYHDQCVGSITRDDETQSQIIAQKILRLRKHNSAETKFMGYLTIFFVVAEIKRRYSGLDSSLYLSRPKNGRERERPAGWLKCTARLRVLLTERAKNILRSLRHLPSETTEMHTPTFIQVCVSYDNHFTFFRVRCKTGHILEPKDK